MKTIAVLLAVVASAAAQRMIGIAALYSNDPPPTTFAGIIMFTQLNSVARLEVQFMSSVLDERTYLIAIHEANGFEYGRNCDDLGPILKLNGKRSPFYTLEPRLADNGFIMATDTWPTGTLVPNLFHSIRGRVIGFYEDATMRRVACGLTRWSSKIPLPLEPCDLRSR